MALGRRFSHSGNYQRTPDTDALVLLLQRLARHRGFNRDLVSSPTLRKFLPANGQTLDAHLFRFIKDRVDGAKLDAATIIYLTQNAQSEISIAHSQRT